MAMGTCVTRGKYREPESYPTRNYKKSPASPWRFSKGWMGPEIQWLQSYVTGDKVYCVYLAPDEATMREHPNRKLLPANRISAVRRLIDPSTAE